MENNKIAVIGLGYVGLPLAIAFAEKYKTIGFDINTVRVEELKKGIDRTKEVSNSELKDVMIEHNPNESNVTKGFYPTCLIDDLKSCEFYIITVPTPTDKNNRPVLIPLLEASKSVGKIMEKNSTVIYESTVYPGLTEEACIPLLEEVSGLKLNEDFYVGYSPERINPGDKTHTVKKIMKVTSGSCEEALIKVDNLYKSIITAGTYRAASIKVAEAAKVIENTQRDINIAFINELAKIFSLLDIDTQDVLAAAGTKWNFLNFKPGLVGGHCIGVDPYYLAQKAQESGYHPEIILAGRRLNDSMGAFIVGEFLKLLINSNHSVKNSKILMLGITFKENCPDIRNSKAIDVYQELIGYGVNIDVYDQWATPSEVKNEYGIDLIPSLNDHYEGIILVVAHNEFGNIDFESLLKPEGVIYDVKAMLDRRVITKRL